MKALKSVRAHADPSVIALATRLFNGKLDDIISELLQNSRRANARHVWIRADQGVISIRDDGIGISDP